MQIINRGQSNSLVFTVTEKSTLSVPYWLFELRGSQDNQIKRFVAQNVSAFTERYDLFLIQEVSAANENLLIGKINMPSVAEYYYKIWEQVSPTNLDPVNTTTLCEEGIIRVYESPAEVIQNNNTPDGLTVYNG